MSSGSEKIVALRSLIDARFPAAHRGARRVVPTGIPRIDELLHGGLATGSLTELVSAVPSGGSQLTLGGILLSTRLSRQRVAVVDAANAFDASGFDDDTLAHLVWVRCGSLAECWRCADVLARDPNFAVVSVDVRGFAPRELLRTRDSIWVRLQRAAEHADTALTVQSDTAVVPNAGARLIFNRPLADDALIAPRALLAGAITAELQRVRAFRVAAG